MRVKIAYTIELEEVEFEVKNLMQKALTYIENASNEAFEATKDIDTGSRSLSTIVEELDCSRKKLSKADMIMSDCLEILKGYEQTLKTIEQEAKDEEL